MAERTHNSSSHFQRAEPRSSRYAGPRKHPPQWPTAVESSLRRRGPRGPNDQKNLISIEIFNLDRNFWSRSKILISMSRFPHKKQGRGGWLARKLHSRSKFSISIEISIFFDLWALWGHGAASTAFLFRACCTSGLETIAPQSRG